MPREIQAGKDFLIDVQTEFRLPLQPAFHLGQRNEVDFDRFVFDATPGMDAGQSRGLVQRHRFRAENWTVVGGEALVTVDDREVVVRTGESIGIPLGAWHRMENRGHDPLTVIEVQTGQYLGEDDIIRYDDDYGRIPDNTAVHNGGTTDA